MIIFTLIGILVAGLVVEFIVIPWIGEWWDEFIEDLKDKGRKELENEDND